MYRYDNKRTLVILQMEPVISKVLCCYVGSWASRQGWAQLVQLPRIPRVSLSSMALAGSLVAFCR